VAMRQIALGQIASPHPLRLTEARTVGLCEDFGGVSLSRIWRERCPEIHSRAFCTQCSVAPSGFAQPTIGDLAIAQSSTSRRPPFTNACTGCHRMSQDVMWLMKIRWRNWFPMTSLGSFPKHTGSTLGRKETCRRTSGNNLMMWTEWRIRKTFFQIKKNKPLGSLKKYCLFHLNLVVG
jgi:hypothetical protein